MSGRDEVLALHCDRLVGRSEIMKRYAIVVEKAKSNYAAYVPDLPGRVATGKTVKQTERRIRDAIEIHVQGMREDGLPIPKPSSVVHYVEVPA
jgi:predicted RNase H-like HicB family nuclease